jgi:Domain of unknown function (DUF4124)
MRTRLAWLLLVALPAHADLYRWIDPATGSVKFSSVPPTDGSVDARVVPYKAPPLPKTTAPTAAQSATPTPVAPAAVVELEGRWRSLLGQIAGITPQDFNTDAEGIRQRVQAYEAVRTELDRLDPAGAARRHAEAAAMVEHLKQR